MSFFSFSSCFFMSFSHSPIITSLLCLLISRIPADDSTLMSDSVDLSKKYLSLSHIITTYLSSLLYSSPFLSSFSRPPSSLCISFLIAIASPFSSLSYPLSFLTHHSYIKIHTASGSTQHHIALREGHTRVLHPP